MPTDFDLESFDEEDYELAAGRAARGPVKVAAPAVVTDYDPDTQLATVQPAVRYEFVDYELDERQWVLPDPVSVPVAFPQGGGYSVTWPLSPGDTGLLVVCDRDIAGWRQTGGQDARPSSRIRFSYSDGVFVPGMRAPASPLDSDAVTDDDAMVIRTPAELRIGTSSADKALAVAEKVRDRLREVEKAFNLHQHAIAGAEVYGPPPSTTVIGVVKPGATTAPSGTISGSPTTTADLSTSRVKVDE